MTFSDLVTHAIKAVKSNAPEILTALGVSGVASTAYLAARGGYDAARKMSDQSPYLSNTEKAKLTWKCYIPAGLSGIATITCIVGSGRAHGRQTDAAVSAYTFTQMAFTEYKDKAKEIFGPTKEQKLRDDLAQEQINRNPPPREITVIGSGDVLCCELRTNRYFPSSHEALQRAVNEINFMITHENYVSLSEFYVMVGLPITEESVHNGWTFEQLMELDFSTALTDDNKPCMTFRYNYVKPLR